MTFLFWMYTLNNVAQAKQRFAQSHDCKNVTFRKSVCGPPHTPTHPAHLF